jgi:hypothetical protein
MEMERWRLDPEHFRPARLELERHRLLARQANAGCNAGEGALCGAMNVTRREQQDAWVTFENRRQRIRITQPDRVRMLKGGWCKNRSAGRVGFAVNVLSSQASVAASSSPCDAPGTVESISTISTSRTLLIELSALSPGP